MITKSKKSPFYYGAASLLSLGLFINNNETKAYSGSGLGAPAGYIDEIVQETVYAPTMAVDTAFEFPQYSSTLSTGYNNADEFQWTEGTNQISYCGYMFTQTDATGRGVPFTSDGNGQTVEVSGSFAKTISSYAYGQLAVEPTLLEDGSYATITVEKATDAYYIGKEGGVATTGDEYNPIQLHLDGSNNATPGNPIKIVLKDLNITREGAGISSSGYVDITLDGAVDVYGRSSYGVNVSGTKEKDGITTIDGTGKLTAEGKGGSGIRVTTTGTLIVEDGTIYAVGAGGFSGIGYYTASAASCGTIDIRGGNVTGVSTNGIGIGGKFLQDENGNDYGGVYISGGEVHGIGSYGIGATSLTSCNIYISGGVVEAKGVGVGLNVGSRTLFFTGGQLKATSSGTSMTSYSVRGDIETTGGQAGVLIVDNNLSYVGSKEAWDMIYIDLRPSDVDPASVLYGSAIGTDATSGYLYDMPQRVYGRVYGDVVLKDFLTLEKGWTLDVPTGTTLRHAVGSTYYSYLAFEGDLPVTIEGDWTGTDDENLKYHTDGNGVVTHNYSILRFKSEPYTIDDMDKENAPFLWGKEVTCLFFPEGGTTPTSGGMIQVIIDPAVVGETNLTLSTGGYYTVPGAMSNGKIEYGQEVGFPTLYDGNRGNLYGYIGIQYLYNNKSIGVAGQFDVGTYDVLIQRKNYLLSFGGQKVFTPVVFIGSGYNSFEVEPYNIGKTETKVTVDWNSDAWALDIVGNLTVESMSKIEVTSGVGGTRGKTDGVLKLGTHYDLIVASAIDGQDDYITVTVQGLGNYTGALVSASVQVAAKEDSAELGGKIVVLDGIDDIYVKPDGTIDLSSMEMYEKSDTGLTNLLVAGSNYTVEPDNSNPNSLQYKVTITDTVATTGAKELVFTITAGHAGTGNSFKNGQLHLVSPFYQRPDGKLYPEDLSLSVTSSTDLVETLNFGTDYTLTYVNQAGATVPWSKQTAFGDFMVYDTIEVTDGSKVISTTYICEVTAVSKLAGATEGTNSVTFQFGYRLAGSNTTPFFSQGAVQVYNENTMGNVYITKKASTGEIVVVSAQGLNLIASVLNETADKVSYPLSTGDIYYVSNFEELEGKTSIVQDPDDPNLYHLTLVAAGTFKEQITFEVPADHVKEVKTAQLAMLGPLADYYIIAPDMSSVYVKPDGTLHTEDLVLKYFTTEIDDTDPNNPVFKMATLPHTDYTLVANPIARTTDFDLVITSLKSEENKVLTATVTAEAAGSGSSFRHGDIELVDTLSVAYLMPSGDGGNYTSGDEQKILKQLPIVVDGSTTLTFDYDYSLSFEGLFSGSGTYTVIATDLRSSDSATKVVMFEVVIEMADAPDGKINFDGNGGTVSGSDSFTAKLDAAVKYTTATQTGYEFLGWTYDRDNLLTLVDQDEYFLVKELFKFTGEFDNIAIPDYEITLYAYWAEDVYSIDFDLNIEGYTAMVTPDSVDVKFTELTSGTLALGAETYQLKRSEYVFLGWTTDKEGKNPVYKADVGYDVLLNSADSVTLYAQWKQYSYTVEFDLNNGTSTAPSTAESSQGNVLVKFPTNPTRTDYLFRGWSLTSGDSETNVLVDSDTLTYKDLATTGSDGEYTATLYAQWYKLAEYNLYFDYNYEGKSYEYKVMEQSDFTKEVVLPAPPLNVKDISF